MKSIRIISAILIVSFLLMTFPAYAENSLIDETSGSFGENITWTLNGGTLTLNGKGSTYDFETDIQNRSLPGGMWSSVNILVIEEGITHIGKNAFNGYFALEKIEFPESLESIGEKAFSQVRADIYFPEGSALCEVGKEAFYDCGSLKTADFSNCQSLESIGENAFANCDEMSYVYLPEDGVLSGIGSGCFSGCESLVNLIIPETVSSVGSMAFSKCSGLHFVQIPSEVGTIGENAFDGSVPVVFAPEGSTGEKRASESNLVVINATHETPVTLRTGTLSNGIIWTYDTSGTLTLSGNGEIEDFPSSLSTPWYRLADKGLVNLVIEEGITHIGRENFANFKLLKKVSLPSTLKTIGKYGFFGCRSLEKIVLPEGFSGLGDESLYSCSALKELHIPSTMYVIGDWSIYGLDSMEKYSVAQGNAAFSSDENGVLFNADKTALIKFPAASSAKEYVIPSTVTEIYPWAFDKCRNLEKVTFGENSAIMSIGDNTFSDSSISHISLPDGIKTIGNAAFDNCVNLKSVVLPEGLQEIKDGAFRNSGITSVRIPGSVAIIGNGAFLGCDNLEKAELSEGTTTIGETTFGSCPALKELNLPASISWIAPSALYYSNNVEGISISENNQYYSVDEYGVVYYCLTELVWYPKNSQNKIYAIKEGVTKVPGGVFENAVNLEEIILPSTLSNIGIGAFMGCKALKRVTIPVRVNQIEPNAFDGCISLEEVVFEDVSNVDTIGAKAFSSCYALKEINIPDSVHHIGSLAFAYCPLLEKVNFSPSSELDSIADNAFINSPVTVYASEGSVAGIYAKKHEIHTPIKVFVNGNPVVFDSPPVIKNDRTMIGMHSVFESLGADVFWDEASQTTTAMKDEIRISITIGSDIMLVNGEEISLDSPAFINFDRTMIPVRAVSEAFGYEVTWNGESKTVEIR